MKGRYNMYSVMDTELDIAIMEFVHDTLQTDYINKINSQSGYYTEGVIDKVKSAVSTIIEKVKKFVDDVHTALTTMYLKHKIKAALSQINRVERKTNKQLQEYIKKNADKFKIVTYKSAENEFKKLSDGYAKLLDDVKRKKWSSADDVRSYVDSHLDVLQARTNLSLKLFSDMEKTSKTISFDQYKKAVTEYVDASDRMMGNIKSSYDKYKIDDPKTGDKQVDDAVMNAENKIVSQAVKNTSGITKGIRKVITVAVPIIVTAAASLAAFKISDKIRGKGKDTDEYYDKLDNAVNDAADRNTKILDGLDTKDTAKVNEARKKIRESGDQFKKRYGN